MTHVAVLGTGRMGGAIARRLAAAGHELTLWNRTPERARALGMGRVAESPADAIRDADIVISSLTDEQAVRDVYLGDGGVLDHAAGRLLIEMSTAGPHIAEELTREAKAHGVRLLEAPVLGTVTAVEGGTLLILAGGAQGDLEQARPVLEQLGEILYAGDAADAQRLKLVANSMLAITSAAAAELLAAATAAGLDRGLVFNVLSRYAPGLKVREAGFVHDTHEPVLFTVRDLIKDLDLALAMYRDVATPAPLTEATRDRYAELLSSSAGLDISAIVRARR